MVSDGAVQIKSDDESVFTFQNLEKVRTLEAPTSQIF
jgi:hypothetical protein